MDEMFLEIFNLYKNDIYRLSYSYTKKLSKIKDLYTITFTYKNINYELKGYEKLKKN